MRYVDRDGTVKELFCAHCGGSIEIVEKTENGKRYSCPCERSTWLSLDWGELDLGIVRDAIEDASDYVIYDE